MLSPLDDLPVHQVAETMASVGTTDRNFYDRCYLNLHACDASQFVVAGLGQYPNLGVTDAFLAVAREGEQRVVRASRPLGVDRLDTRVGPLRVEVRQGLQRVRLVCEETDGLALDVVFDGSVPAYEEPRMQQTTPWGRRTMDTCRFLQTGTWTGVLSVDGVETAVTPDRWWGNRDRSWGVRPVGEPEPAGAPSDRRSFFWNYVVARFADFSLVYLAQEDEHGRRSMEEGVRLLPDGGVEHLGRPEHQLEFRSGTRDVTAAKVVFGGGLELRAEVLRPLYLARGTGYGFDADWRHGAWQGPETVVQSRRIDTRGTDVQPVPGAITDSLARFETSDGNVGFGLLEAMTLGPHTRYFQGWDDVA